MRDERIESARRKKIVPMPVRARLDRFRGAQRAGMFGLPELVALAAALVLLLTAFSAYFFYLKPQRARLEALGLERDQLQTRLRSSTQGVERNESTQANVARIIENLQQFETGTLASRNESSTPIIEELNEKTRRNALTRAQFSFTRQDETVADGKSLQRTMQTGTNKRPSIFPSIEISLSIEGAYTNLRRFIHDIETSRRFIVINSVELEGATNTGSSSTREAPVIPGITPSPTTGATGRNALVNLRLDMSAYFRRNPAEAGGANVSANGTAQ